MLVRPPHWSLPSWSGFVDQIEWYFGGPPKAIEPGGIGDLAHAPLGGLSAETRLPRFVLRTVESGLFFYPYIATGPLLNSVQGEDVFE
jgi:hypothetical protein